MSFLENSVFAFMLLSSFAIAVVLWLATAVVAAAIYFLFLRNRREKFNGSPLPWQAVRQLSLKTGAPETAILDKSGHDVCIVPDGKDRSGRTDADAIVKAMNKAHGF